MVGSDRNECTLEAIAYVECQDRQQEDTSYGAQKLDRPATLGASSHNLMFPY